MNGLRLLNNLAGTLFCLYLPAVSLFAQAGAGLAGSVSDESNKPVASAFIIATRDTLPAASGRATSAPDGTFRISGLPAGSYSVCVQVAGGAFLDTCEWSTSPLRIDVKAGQAVAGLLIKLKKAAILQVRLNDPANLLGPTSASRMMKNRV